MGADVWTSGDVTLYCGDCLDILPTLAAGSVDLTITSPPYLNLRAYSKWETYVDYLKDMASALHQCARVARPGRHVCWNVQPYLPDRRDGERWHYPLSSDIIRLAYDAGMMLESTITWHKTNAVCQRMFGSYPFPPTIIYTPNTEDIHIFRKPGNAEYTKTPDSKLTKQEWADWTTHIWDMPISYNKQHAATFPLELPLRLMRLHSLVGDTVLDCFAGIATTSVACVQTGRKFIGIEIDAGYFAIARKRIEAAQMQLRMF